MLEHLLLITPLFLLACGEEEKNAPKTTAISADAGATLWKSTCLSCHGADGMGMPDISPAIVGSAFVQSSSDKELVAYITVGRKADDPRSVMQLEMPAKGGNPMLKETDMLNLVAYMRSLQ